MSRAKSPRTLARALLVAAACLSALPSLGCVEHDDERIRLEVRQLTVSEGEAVRASCDRLARDGRRALPPLEAALHTADVPGRKNVILALRRIGDPDAFPLLAHVAAVDAAADVRHEALWTLRSFAREPGARGEAAKKALRLLDEYKGSVESG